MPKNQPWLSQVAQAMQQQGIPTSVITATLRELKDHRQDLIDAYGQSHPHANDHQAQLAAEAQLGTPQVIADAAAISLRHKHQRIWSIVLPCTLPIIAIASTVAMVVAAITVLMSYDAAASQAAQDHAGLALALCRIVPLYAAGHWLAWLAANRLYGWRWAFGSTTLMGVLSATPQFDLKLPLDGPGSGHLFLHAPPDFTMWLYGLSYAAAPLLAVGIAYGYAAVSSSRVTPEP